MTVAFSEGKYFAKVWMKNLSQTFIDFHYDWPWIGGESMHMPWLDVCRLKCVPGTSVHVGKSIQIICVNSGNITLNQMSSFKSNVINENQ